MRNFRLLALAAILTNVGYADAANLLLPHQTKDLILLGVEGAADSTTSRSLYMRDSRYIYVSGEPGMETVDAIDPTNLTLTNDWTGSSAKVNAISSRGNTLYVANWNPGTGLAIFDIANPASPSFIRFQSTVAHTGDVDVYGNLMYIIVDNGVGTTGINTYDLSANPTNPPIINYLDIGDRLANNVARYGKYMYFTHKGQLRVYDASDPTNPVFVRINNFTSLLGSLKVWRGYLYMLGRETAPGEQGGLFVLSLTDPSNPTQVGYWSQNEPRDMYFLNKYCVIPASGSGIFTVNLTNPTTPTTASTWSVSWPGTGNHGGYPVTVTGANDYVFIGTTSGNNPECGDFTCSYYGARLYSEKILTAPPIVSVDLGTTDVTNGISHPQPADGDSTPDTIGGRNCRRNNLTSILYFYFSLDDGFAYQGNNPNVFISFDYYDTGTGSLTLNYDGTPGAYTTGPSVMLTNTNTWKTATWQVTNGYFGNRENAGADFRITKSGGGFFYIDTVKTTPQLPTAVISANPTTGAPPLTVTLNGTSSSDTNGVIVNYEWDFGDGTSHFGIASTSKTYATAGNYTVTLTVTDDDGMTNSTTVPISVIPTNVSINLGPTNIENNMTHPTGGDGDTIGATGIAGRDCRRNMDPTYNDFYFYFTVADIFSFQGNSPDVWIAYTYYDEGSTGSITLNYDSTSNPYKDGGSVLLTGTNTWKTQKVHVTDAYFGNRENNGGDFRVYVGNVVRYLDGSSVQTTTPGTPPPGQASNPNPANGATGVGTNPSLTWTAGANATAHNVYFGTANPPAFIGVQTGTTYVPGTLTAGTYFWRIDEYRDNGGTTSGIVWSFSVGSPPGQATTPNPASGATLVPITSSLSWTAGSGATSHDVNFGTSNPPPFVINQTATTYTPATMTPNTTYFWRIDEKNTAGTTTGVVWSFTTLPLPGVASAPTPANGATLVDINTDLSWTAGSNVASHDVRFGTANPPPFVINQTGTSYDPGTMTPNTLYYWRIDEKNSSGTTTGTVWSFTTLPLPGAASAPNPANGATLVDKNADLSWTAGSNVASHDVRFGTANPPPFVLNQTGTTYDPGTMTPNTLYYWRIDEINTSGTTTGAVWSFTTLPLPGVASSPNPANGATLIDKNTDLSWTAGSNTTSHDVRFGTANPPPFVINQAGTSYDPGTMTPNTLYYWRIDEINTSGTTTGTVWSFTTLPLPGTASAPNPANAATGVSITATLTWTAGSNTTSHDVRFGTTNPPPFVVNQTGTTYNPGALNPTTLYYWRIDEINTSGTTTGTVWSFTTATPPAAPTVTAPTNSSTVTTLTPAITWSGAAHDQYQVRVSQQNDSNTSTNGYDSGTVTGTGNTQVSGTLRNYSFYFVFVRLHNVGGWGAWSAAGYNFIVDTDSTNGTVYLGNALLSASGWTVYDGTCENGCTGITTSIVSDGGSNVEKLIDASTTNRSKLRYSPGNVDFTTGASVNARMRATSITGTPTYNLGISNGNVGGHFLRLETFQVSLVDINGNIRGTYALDGTVYHKYQLTVKNTTPGNNATATWKVYVDGTLQITYTGAGTDNGFDGFMAGHAGTTATGTWWFDNISGRQDGEFTPAQWDPVY